MKTPEELIEMGLAEWYRDRLIPIIKGADGEGEDDAGKKEEKPEAKKEEKQQESTFVAPRTQEEMDQMVADRIRRERAKTQERYGDYDDLKKKAEAYDQIEESNKTELEKAEAARAAAEEKAKAAEERAKEALLRVQVIAEGTRRGMADPEDALALMDRSVLQYGDDGQAINIAEAVEALLKAKPHLVGGGRSGNGADQGARTSPQQISSVEGLTPEQIATAVREGKLTEYLQTPNK